MTISANRTTTSPLLTTDSAPTSPTQTRASASPAVTKSHADVFTCSSSSAGSLPPRPTPATYAHTRSVTVSPIGKLLLGCFQVVIWPFQQLKLAFMWLTASHLRFDRRHSDTPAKSCEEATQAVEPDKEELHRLAKQPQTSPQHHLQQLRDLEPQVQREREETKNLADLLVRRASASADLAIITGQLGKAEQARKAAEIEKARLIQLNAKARNAIPSLTKQNDTLQAQLVKVRNELQESKKSFAELSERSRHLVPAGQTEQNSAKIHALAQKIDSTANYIVRHQLNCLPSEVSPLSRAIELNLEQIVWDARCLPN